MMRPWLIFLGLGGLVTLLTACMTPTITEDVLHATYLCPGDKTILVEYFDEGNLAKMTLTKMTPAKMNNNRGTDKEIKITLLNAPSASGAYYRNDAGYSIHSKDNYAMIETPIDGEMTCQLVEMGNN